MDLKYSVVLDKCFFTIYWDDYIVYSGRDTNGTVELTDGDGWHSLVLEAERPDPFNNYGSVFFESLTIGGTDTWPVDAGDTTVMVPFWTSQGYCYTESGNSYIALDNSLHSNSYIRIWFLVRDGSIVDHYYDRNLTDKYYETAALHHTTQYNFQWSEPLGVYIHRHMTTDHMCMVWDPKDQSTWGINWFGPRFEYTDTALLEDQGRAKYPEFYLYGSNLTPTDDGLSFTLWTIKHVFGRYYRKELPAKLLAPILKRV